VSRRRTRDLPLKADPARFGGGRVRGGYTLEQIERLLCAVAGCGRAAWASWSACYDRNALRPVCPEHDVALNVAAAQVTGDPEGPAKLRAYAAGLEQDCGRPLELPPATVAWLEGV